MSIARTAIYHTLDFICSTISSGAPDTCVESLPLVAHIIANTGCIGVYNERVLLFLLFIQNVASVIHKVFPHVENKSLKVFIAENAERDRFYIKTFCGHGDMVGVLHKHFLMWDAFVYKGKKTHLDSFFLNYI